MNLADSDFAAEQTKMTALGRYEQGDEKVLFILSDRPRALERKNLLFTAFRPGLPSPKPLKKLNPAFHIIQRLICRGGFKQAPARL